MIRSEITGTTFVHAREGQYGTMYSLQLSKKNKDDQWENGYINAQFKKDVVVPNGSKINITSGWLTFYKAKEDNRTVVQIFVNEFEILEEGTPKETSDSFKTTENPNDLSF